MTKNSIKEDPVATVYGPDPFIQPDIYGPPLLNLYQERNILGGSLC